MGFSDRNELEICVFASSALPLFIFSFNTNAVMVGGLVLSLGSDHHSPRCAESTTYNYPTNSHFTCVCCFKVSDVKRAVKSADALFEVYNKVKAPTHLWWPLLVIDEANRMEGWSSTAERDDILGFLVDVSVFKATVLQTVLGTCAHMSCRVAQLLERHV